MNWIDVVMILLLLTAMVIGSKKGLVRELSALVLFLLAAIVSLAYLDRFAAFLVDKMDSTPLVAALLAFMLLLGISYGVFKGAGWVFYKIADVKSQGKRDQVGGAIVGFVRGWVSIGALLFIVFLLPMPEKFYTAFEGSFFGPTMAKTLPFLFDETSVVHPNSPEFMQKLEQTLLETPASSTTGTVDEDRAEAHRVLYQFDRFFSIGSNNET